MFNSDKLLALKRLMDDPLFKGAVTDIRLDIAQAMIQPGTSSDDRDWLFYEVQALDRLLGKLASYTNELLMTPVKRTHS